MPELPEVETMVRGIRPFVEGRKIEAVKRCGCRFRPISIRPRFESLAKRLAGQTIEGVGRLGKRVVLSISGGSAVVIEPRMTGLMLLSDPPDREHLRMEWRLAGSAEYRSLWFWDRRGLGTVRLFGPGELERHFREGTVGPDALEMTVESWQQCVRGHVAGDQNCVARPANGGGHRKSLRQRDLAPLADPSGPACRPSQTGGTFAAQRRGAGRARGSDSRRRIDPE